MKSKILKDVTLIVEIIVVAFLFSISIFSILSSKNNGIARDPIFGMSIMPVKSDSMKPEFETGDLIFGKKVKDVNSLKVDDIITYKYEDYSGLSLITHRIVEISEDGTIYAQGDNRDMSKVKVAIEKDDIVAVFTGKIKNAGNFFLFFEDQMNYLVFIILPLILLFIWNVFSFVKMLLDLSRKKAIETAVNGGEVTDELKEIAIKEYLERQKQEQLKAKEQEEVKSEETKDNNSEVIEENK